MSFDQRILEVRGGQATPASISLTVGTPLTPVSIGSEGMWRVEGPGTLPIHAYVYFDGTVLFVQSADDGQPVTINRKKVSTTWTEVNCPSALELGGVSILYQLEQEFEGDPATVATPIEEIANDMRERGLLPPSAPSLVDAEPATVMSGDIRSFQGLAPMRVPPVPPASASQGVPLDRPSAGRSMRGAVVTRDDAESTTFNPLDNSSARLGDVLGSSASMGRLPNPLVNPSISGSFQAQPNLGASGAFGVPSGPFTSPLVPTGSTPPALIGELLKPPPKPEAPKEYNGLWDRFKKEWTSFSNVKRITMVLFIPGLFSAWQLMMEDPLPEAPKKKKTKPTSSAVSADAGPAMAETSDSSVLGSAVPVASALAQLPTDGKSLERFAIDAVANGNYLDAARYYEMLAEKSGDNKAFAEAARIMRKRATKK